MAWLAAGLVAFPAAAQTVSPQLSNDIDWRLIGPSRAGRAVTVGGVPGDAATFYFGSVDGGIWKTTDAGTVWKPIFDKQPIASIGALAVSPSNPGIIYAGTRESDIRSDLASGNGVYRSTDAGKTWQHLGLDQTRQIAKIVIDPTNPDIVYVGALGHAYGPNPERGVYKSIDGGTTWQLVLYKSPDNGVVDLAIAAAAPRILFASLWNAHRPAWSTYAPIAGPGSGIYRSTDAGESWQECAERGLPGAPWGRSGVAVSSDGRRVSALVEAAKSGLYVSKDGGTNWSLANADPRLTSRAWYFNRITIDPEYADVIYVPNVALMGSRDGGKSVFVVRGTPGGDDYHELWVDPKDSSRLLLATVQGTTISLDQGATWSTWYNQPTAQMYHVTTDNEFPYTVYGSQRDSGGSAEPSRTDHGQISARDWFPARGSESGYVAVDPKNAQILYVSGGYGTVVRFDRHRSLSQDITPWPIPVFGSDIATRKYRDPWTTPLIFPGRFAGALSRHTVRDAHYRRRPALDRDKSRPDRLNCRAPRDCRPGREPAAASQHNAVDIIGKHDGPTVENAVQRVYGSLSTVAPSYLEKNVIRAGSDTGVISLTRDGGKSWADVTPPAVRAPGKSWSRVSLIDPSHFDPGTAYESVERHRMDDQAPYLYRTRDYGHSWLLFVRGLNAPAFVNAVRADPKQRGLLYAGTGFGIYVSFDDGDYWQPLQLNLPVSSVRDMVVHGDDLVIATHGRSFWILDDMTPLRQASAHAKGNAAFLYRPQVTIRVDNDGFAGTPLPPEEPTAENPPNGAILDYYLPAQAHAVELNIYSADHKLVRHISSGEGGDNERKAQHMDLPIAERWLPVPQRLERFAGMHRFIWNLAWGTSGVAESDEPDDGNGGTPYGPRVAPGQYTVELQVDGNKLPVETMVVVMDPRSTAKPAELQQQFEISYKIFKDSLESRRALAEIGSVQQQLANVKGELATAAATLTTAISAVLTGSHAMGLDQANTELTAALNVAESSDRAVPSQAMADYVEVHAASLANVEKWAALKQGRVAEFNHKLAAHNLSPIAIAEIEREVEYLLTR
jgi:photosystem II stability/assembly factor-like uncharacterized protein